MNPIARFLAIGSFVFASLMTVLPAMGGETSGLDRLGAAKETAQIHGGPVPIAKLGVVSPTSGSLLPFTVGQPLIQGAVPAKWGIVADVPEFQCVIKNRWPDGSAKFAICSGRVDMVAGKFRSLQLSSSPVSASSVLSTGVLKAAGMTASVQFGAFGTARWSVLDWDRPFQQWVAGPQMSSWIYRKPIGPDPHLVAWLEVRAYKGGHIEVLPWVENGYLTVPGPNEKSGIATFTLGGTERFSRPLTLLNHQRVVLAEGSALTHWLYADPQVTPRHDVKYFMATRLVPNYQANTHSRSRIFDRLVTTYEPLAVANHAPGMGMAGYHSSIGLLPEWDVAYLSSGADPRAYAAVLVNGYAAGRYGIHYRDERTNRPLSFASHPNLVMSYGSGVSDIGTSSSNQVTPVPSGATPPRFATSHHPSLGYMAYLVTGWNYFMEENQFVATTNYLKQGDTNRQKSRGVMLSYSAALTPRGAAWAERSLAQAAAITPDDDPLHAQFSASVDANIEYYHGHYVAKSHNPLGLVQPYGSFNPNIPLKFQIWMDDFFTASFGYLKDLEVHSAALQSKLDAFLAWKYRAVVGRLGGSGVAEFAYPYAAQYTVNYAPSGRVDWAGGEGPWYSSWGAVARSMEIPTNGEPGSALAVGYPNDPTSYWGNLAPALAYAVDHNAKGGKRAWLLMTSASNYPALAVRFDDAPVWSVWPHTVPK
ncbi:hypothetical protein [Azohydromonas australica]|uniref:hypothetical protein n=1 Tax=Azohydromonas australica TaxID=364039 RepID=UPI0004131EB9|nr:hypothetical protein [Azohydromonas australica]